MSNHNKQIISKEDKEEYNSKAFAQELLRARVDEPRQFASLGGREEDYYPTPDPKWKLYIAEEESYKQERKKQKLDHLETNKNYTK